VHDAVPENEIRTVLLGADDENKERFSEFYSLLSAGDNPLATVSIYREQTTQKWISRPPRRISLIEDILFKNKCLIVNNETVEAFKYYKDNWDEIQPRHIFRSLTTVERELNHLFEEYPRIPARIDKRKLYETYSDILDFRYYGREDTAWQGLDNLTITILEFVLESSGLRSLMDDFSIKAKQFEADVDLLQRKSQNGRQADGLQRSIEEHAEVLKKKNIEIGLKANHVEELLKNCIDEGSTREKRTDAHLNEIS